MPLPHKPLPEDELGIQDLGMSTGIGRACQDRRHGKFPVRTGESVSPCQAVQVAVGLERLVGRCLYLIGPVVVRETHHVAVVAMLAVPEARAVRLFHVADGVQAVRPETRGRQVPLVDDEKLMRRRGRADRGVNLAGQCALKSGEKDDADSAK